MYNTAEPMLSEEMNKYKNSNKTDDINIEELSTNWKKIFGKQEQFLQGYTPKTSLTKKDVVFATSLAPPLFAVSLTSSTSTVTADV